MDVSVLTLVNDLKMYEKNIVRTIGDHELIEIVNAPTAAVGLNYGISKASSEILVICHQDVVFPNNWVEKLEHQISIINDKQFGVLGTFGVDMDYQYVGNIKDPHNNPKLGNLPCQAMTLDEHCLVIRKSSGLNFNENLPGFHFYGADICLRAAMAGMKNYVIDARLEHLSGGKVDKAFSVCAEEFRRQWQSRSPYRIVKTTCGLLTMN